MTIEWAKVSVYRNKYSFSQRHQFCPFTHLVTDFLVALTAFYRTQLTPVG